MIKDRRFWLIVLAFGVIALAHYFSPQERALGAYTLGRHTVERIAFILPIIGATCFFGQRGGSLALALAFVAMLPRVFFVSPHPADALLETCAVALVGYAAVWAIETQAREKRLRQQLGAQLERAYRRLQMLYATAQTLNSTLELQTVLDQLARATAQVLNVRACSIRLLDETGARLNVAAAHGLSDAYIQKGALILAQNPLARAVLAGEVIAIDDVARDTRLQYPTHAIAEGIRAMLSAPLIGKRGALGLIRAYSSEPAHFSAEDATFLSAIASQGSIALENALAYRQLGKLDQMKSAFVLTVTHELRSPVGVVQSLLRTLRGGFAGELTDQQREVLDHALCRADFLQTLITDLLDLAAGKSEFDGAARAPVALRDVVADVIARFQIPAEEKELHLQAHCSDAPLAILATRDGVDRILTNLVANALRYTPAGGRVAVKVGRANDHAQIEIADTGIGIPDDAMKHLFEEFYRAPNAQAWERHGTGLGLAITRDLVKRFGGCIAVQSKLGAGTTFVVTFPVVESA
jgi:signal transduction histidine kinase